jgi:MFS family permease
MDMSQQSQTHPLSLKEAERKAFRLSTSQDGLYDIFIGAYIALLSTAPWLDENGLSSPWNVILIYILGLMIFLGVILLKKFVVAPRIGQVRFSPERKKRLRRLAIGMAAIFLLTLVMFGMTVSAIYFREPIFDGSIEWALPLDLVHTAAGIFIFTIFCLIGYVNDNARYYLYGFLFGLGYVISTVLQDITGDPFYWPWMLAGLVAVVIGLVLFVRFLREYPLPQDTVYERN